MTFQHQFYSPALGGEHVVVFFSSKSKITSHFKTEWLGLIVCDRSKEVIKNDERMRISGTLNGFPTEETGSKRT